MIDVLLSFALPIVALGLPAMAEALYEFIFGFPPETIRLGTT